MMAVKTNLESYYPKVKEMYENGVPIAEISKDLHLGNVAIYKIIAFLELPKRKIIVRKKDDSKIVYADNSVKLEKVEIAGKVYTDITPVFSPR